MGNLFTKGVGNLLTEVVGNCLTTLVGKVLDIYKPYIMHHKFCVMDNQVVIIGSYNWTASAEERNNENLIIIRDCCIAIDYIRKFDRLWYEHHVIEESMEQQSEKSVVPSEEVKPKKEQAPL